MKKRFNIILLTSLLFVFSCSKSQETPSEDDTITSVDTTDDTANPDSEPEPEMIHETLFWEENFEGDTLNLETWTFELGNGCPNLCGWGNNEPQFYTDENHRLEDGMLYITANKEANGQYTSTRIITKDKFEFQYGKIEARLKLPVGTGVWPAFWMLGANIDEVSWPRCGEIDIVEYVGKEPDYVFNSIHTPSSYGATINTRKTKIEEIEEGFHVFEANWTDKKIEFFVDGELLYVYQPTSRTADTWPFDQSCFFILNVAIGGNFGGPEIDDSIFPQEFVIDYIKVYQN